MNRTAQVSALLSLLTVSTAWSQVFTIWAEAPEAVDPGETFSVEFWASVEGEPWEDGVSAFAGFGIDAIGSGDVVSVTAAVLEDWAAGFGTQGSINGINVEGVSGGQIANVFDCLNPNINMNNPIRLFSIEVMAGLGGSIAYTPANPNINGGLSFYPNSQDGASIVAPNDPGTTLEFFGATTRIVPAPAALGVFGFATLATRRRRRTIQIMSPMKIRRLK